MEDVKSYDINTFESIKHYTDDGIEYWLARELQTVLEYAQWRRFNEVIDRAKIACETSGNAKSDHFASVGKTIKMPKSATKTIDDYMLTRYACYLIVQNGDPRKEIIALGQTYCNFECGFRVGSGMTTNMRIIPRLHEPMSFR